MAAQDGVLLAFLLRLNTVHCKFCDYTSDFKLQRYSYGEFFSFFKTINFSQIDLFQLAGYFDPLILTKI